jgi:hypothetical protein
MSTCFATIASGNYLAYVTVLRDSLARHAPEASFELLVVDRRTPELDAAIARLGLHATYAHELGLADFEHIAFKFDVVELNTALKPTFLKRLLAAGHERAVYLDPDIRVFSAPTPVLEALDTHQIVLTPHAMTPVLDGQRPSDIDYLRVGSYNLGFVAVRSGPDAHGFLDWWERRCLGLGFNDFTYGVFVDQKWVDLAPSYFASVRILRHPGCNVAYWNLHERSVARSGEGWTVNGEPLAFFHFSGVKAEAPHLLSRHQDRHVPVPGSPLAQLVADYCAALLAAGHAQHQRFPYGFARLHDGTRVTGLMRRASCVLEVDPRDPFDPASPLQRMLRAQGLVEGGEATPAATQTTMKFDPSDRRVRLVNGLVRLLAKVAGPDRVAQLLRYATFLTWGANYPAVLLRKPFDLRHHDPRAAVAAMARTRRTD